MKTLNDVRAELPAYPIEIEFPDIARWKEGNRGVSYVHTFDSGVAGPHVMILALMHGNEVSGAIALDTLLDAGRRPVKGMLSLGFANVGAYQRFDPHHPDAARYIDEDMNRVWNETTLRGPRESQEIRRARELRPLLDTVDLLLDIHSMHEAAAPLMMCGPLVKGLQLARALGFPENIVVDAGHANGTRLRDYSDFGNPASQRNALLVETGQHFSRRSKDIALDVACRFLAHSGVIPAADLQAFPGTQQPAAQRIIQITQAVVARSLDFTFTQQFKGLEVIPAAGTPIGRDGAEEIVTPYDNCVLVQPSLRHLGPGVTVMRLGKFVA